MNLKHNEKIKKNAMNFARERIDSVLRDLSDEDEAESSDNDHETPAGNHSESPKIKENKLTELRDKAKEKI